ncbi:MAG: TfoX/Sxy family protein [Treponema sp.]|jgi:DNA transformation protein|nr:TfoX/Sxy family protein [Treponema sp.]
MARLSEMVNIGKVLEKQLNEIGINTFEKLRKTGSKNAWLKIRHIDSSACYNRLCALEGAIQGIRWHNLSEENKNELKEFYNQWK